MPIQRAPHPTVEERTALGKAARKSVPRSSHEGWEPASDRPDPVELLTQQDETREQDLVPVRHGRMMVSPFTFYRGAARIMAADLAAIPRAGLEVQLCGDAYLANFGVFASPERNLLFDLNDFDETLPGPFEYDVARLAASFVIAGRNNEFTDEENAAVSTTAIVAYRESMATFAQLGTLAVWYSCLAPEEILDVLEARLAAKPERKAAARAEKILNKARTRDSLQALSKLGELVDGEYRIVSQPPIVVPIREFAATYGVDAAGAEAIVDEQFHAYRATLADDRRHLLERFKVVDWARKVVGVGSVGTLAFIVLLQGRDADDPLFLQVKQASASVLEEHLPKSAYAYPGERVVRGQRMMQAASDIFLGWTDGQDRNRHFYWRQLRDMKGSADTEIMSPETLGTYARMCGSTLARAHARSGDPIAIATYLGTNDRFDRAMTEFAVRYADQNQRDFEEFVAAIKSGRLDATEGV